MKFFKAVLIILIVLVVVLSLTKNMVAKIGIEKGVEAVTGLKMDIRSFNIGILNTLVGMDDMKLYNPKGFLDPVMVDMEEIYVDYNLSSILKGTIHLEEMRIVLTEFVVVKNEKGELNLNALKPVKDNKLEGKPLARGKTSGSKGEAPDIRIDKLQLKIGKVIYKDYSKGGAPLVKTYDINIDETFTEITDPNKLVSLVIVKALMRTPIATLANFDLGGLQSTVVETLAGAQKVTTVLFSQATGTLGKTTGETQVVVKETTETLKKTAEDLKETLKLSFGGSTGK